MNDSRPARSVDTEGLHVLLAGESWITHATHLKGFDAFHFGGGRTAAFASDLAPHWAPQEFLDWPGYVPPPPARHRQMHRRRSATSRSPGTNRARLQIKRAVLPPAIQKGRGRCAT